MFSIRLLRCQKSTITENEHGPPIQEGDLLIIISDTEAVQDVKNLLVTNGIFPIYDKHDILTDSYHMIYEKQYFYEIRRLLNNNLTIVGHTHEQM